LLPPLLADVSIAVQVVAFLRVHGVDVLSAYDEGWGRWGDADLLREGQRQGRFVLTHDADFGRLAVAGSQPYHGILYLRPGDDPPATVIRGLAALLAFEADWRPPLIAVYRAGRLRLRRPSGPA
jgi:predicted nuclease of predicted toxin-antitoxin system